MEVCGLGVAVRNAVPRLKRKADIVTRASYGKGVAELIDRMVGKRGSSPRKTSRGSRRRGKGR